MAAKICSNDIIIINDGNDDLVVSKIIQGIENCQAGGSTVVPPHPVIATFGIPSPLVREQMLLGNVKFAVVPQLYLQSTMIVVMASVYVLTGKKLSKPLATDSLYLSGPTILKPGVRNKLPEDAAMNCEYYGYPICEIRSQTEDGIITDDILEDGGKDELFLKPYMSDILQTLPDELIDSNRVCNSQGCLNRGTIRLGGVLHGTTTCKFFPFFVEKVYLSLDTFSLTNACPPPKRLTSTFFSECVCIGTYVYV